LALEGEGGWWLPGESAPAVGGLAPCMKLPVAVGRLPAVCRLSSSQASGRNTAAEPAETEPKRIVAKSKLKVDFRS